MAVSLVFSGVVYHVGSNELAHGLRRQNQRIYEDFPVFNGSPLLNNDKDLANGEHRLLARLVFFNLIVLVGAGLVSYYLAKRTLEPIEEAHARQKRFTADVSHELRTPITALKMGSEVALMDKAASKQVLRTTLQSNIEEADKLGILVDNLLRLSRLDADELRLSFNPVAASAVGQAALDKVQAAASKKNIAIKPELAGGTIDGDKDSLVQLVTILLDNAIKYSPAGTTVLLRATMQGDTTLLEVKDEGIGIEQKALEHVFDRFYRADSSRQKEDSEGYGLGLSIAKMIADLHHASITISSVAGKGTTARVVFSKA